MRLIKHCSPEPTNCLGEQAFSPGFKSASKRDKKLRIVQYRCSWVTFFSYLRSVEKMCRGDFTFFSVCFLPCGLISLSLLWHFHCCVTKVCIILPRESTLMKLSGPRKPHITHTTKNLVFSYFFNWCPSPNLSFVDTWNTSTVGTGKRTWNSPWEKRLILKKKVTHNVTVCYRRLI